MCVFVYDNVVIINKNVKVKIRSLALMNKLKRIITYHLINCLLIQPLVP